MTMNYPATLLSRNRACAVSKPCSSLRRPSSPRQLPMALAAPSCEPAVATTHVMGSILKLSGSGEHRHHGLRRRRFNQRFDVHAVSTNDKPRGLAGSSPIASPSISQRRFVGPSPVHVRTRVELATGGALTAVGKSELHSLHAVDGSSCPSKKRQVRQALHRRDGERMTRQTGLRYPLLQDE